MRDYTYTAVPTTMSPAAKTRNTNLDALRGMASIGVFLFHAGAGILHTDFFMYDGSTGVIIFFLLSGYIMADVHMQPFLQQATIAKKAKYQFWFMWNRVLRIMPCLWLVIALFYYPIFFVYGDTKPGPDSIAWFFILGIPFCNEQIGVLWTLHLEMYYFYPFLQPLLFLLLHVLPHRCVGFLVALNSAASIVVYIAMVTPDAKVYFCSEAYYSPLYRMHEFACGVMLHVLCTNTKKLAASLQPHADAIFWCVCGIAYIVHLYVNALILLPLWMLMVWIAAQCRLTSLEGRVWQFLGDISYPIYLLHPGLVMIIMQLIGMNAVNPALNTALFVGTAVMSMAAYAMHVFLEKRFYNRFKVAMPKQQQRADDVDAAAILPMPSPNTSDAELVI